MEKNKLGGLGSTLGEKGQKALKEAQRKAKKEFIEDPTKLYQTNETPAFFLKRNTGCTSVEEIMKGGTLEQKAGLITANAEVVIRGLEPLLEDHDGTMNRFIKEQPTIDEGRRFLDIIVGWRYLNDLEGDFRAMYAEYQVDVLRVILAIYTLEAARDSAPFATRLYNYLQKIQAPAEDIAKLEADLINRKTGLSSFPPLVKGTDGKGGTLWQVEHKVQDVALIDLLGSRALLEQSLGRCKAMEVVADKFLSLYSLKRNALPYKLEIVLNALDTEAFLDIMDVPNIYRGSYYEKRKAEGQPPTFAEVPLIVFPSVATVKADKGQKEYFTNKLGGLV